jgi:hypothetical protein
MADLLDDFAERGIVRLDAVFDETAAKAMQDAVWRAWRSLGVVSDDPTTWSSAPVWESLKRAKRDLVFHGVLGPSLRALADTLLGEGWTTSTGFGNLLASFPDTERWTLPARSGQWHSDFAYTTPMAPLPALRVFAVFGDVEPSGGGTLLVAGSHRMVERFVASQPKVAARPAKHSTDPCHRSNPWLAEVTRGDESAPGRAERFLHQATDVDGIDAQVIEACGPAGTVYVCHPWTIHCRPPNASNRPRLLRSPTLSRAE